MIATNPARRLKETVGCKARLSRDSLLHHLFAHAFKGLVYPQIWEDPEVDMEALAIAPDHHVVAIASGGCNILSYLTADPRKITALDLSPSHVALVRLKLAAAAHLPTWDGFYRFLGDADETANIDAYRLHLRDRLDAETRAYWDRRRAFGLGRPRIAMFSENVYRHGLLGRFIGFGHAVARLYGIKPKTFLGARSLEEQRQFFDVTVAPLFDKPLVRWATSQRLSLYGLGIPPAQYEVLAGGAAMADVLRDRLRKLTCDFSLDDNYFAWQAFGRGYGKRATAPLPPYLKRTHFESVRTRAGRVEVKNCAFTEYLAQQAAQSVDRFVLLDAQDWMTDAQLNALWQEITRTARPGARVIFRTAAAPSLLPGRVDERVLMQWHYEETASRAFTARDRSAIYGGFHLYIHKGNGQEP
jgi:S-adenosylmethionine-diacylglycerol 3-amino-3-carboxypropyl transferase